MQRAIAIVLIAVSCLVFAAPDPASAAAGPSEGNIAFTGDRVKIYFQPPLRQGDGSPLNRDVSRLNFVTNLLDHYLAALIRMGHIASDTQLTLEYSSANNTTTNPGPNRITLDDLGLNAILLQVNAALKKMQGTNSSRLIDDVKSVMQIRDHLPRRTDTVETRHGFSCLSNGLREIHPDIDFELTGTDDILSLRSDETTNHIVRNSSPSTGSVLLEHGRWPYGSLRCSSDGKWLAFTENGCPKLLHLRSRGAQPLALFPDINAQLLDMEWSPTGQQIAGIVLNRNTLDRILFVYDASAGKFDELVSNQSQIDGNYQFAYPSWSPNGKRLFFVTDHDINLIDLGARQIVPKLVTVSSQLSEIVWSPDARSFALVEVDGQARDKQEFDDRDFRGSVLRRYNLNDLGKAIELPEQRHLSSDTIKLVSFWTRDRVLYLEGHLRMQKTSSPLWDLSTTFAARLTPEPGSKSTSAGSQIGAVDLAMEYCYAFKTMDSKFRLLYDAGMAQGNQLFMDRFKTRWFIGLPLPPAMSNRVSTFCLRHMPYPFPERNEMYFPPLSKADITSLVTLLESYNLRRFELSRDLQTLYFLSNSRGPMSLWKGSTAGIGEVKPPRASDENEEESGEATDNASVTTDTTASPPPPGAASGLPPIPEE